MAVVNHRFAGFALIFLVAFAMIIVPAVPTGETDKVNSGIAEFDDFYKERSDHAMDEAVKSFEPHPEKVTAEFNKQVGAELEGDHVRPGGKKH